MRGTALHILIAVVLLSGSTFSEGKAETAAQPVPAVPAASPAPAPTPTPAPVASPKVETAPDIGVGASEVLAGNGTRAGYVLGHGSVMPGTEWVYVGGKRVVRNRDYTIDYESGTLFFTEPVRRMDSVRVDYRYSGKSKGERSVAGPGVLGFSLGKNAQMNLLYSYRAADPALGMGVPDLLTYGMSQSFSFGQSSKVTGMVYVATPQVSNRMSLTTTPAANGKAPQQVKKDRLVVQNADLGVGKVRLKLGFQDVGENFAGFASLKDSKAAPADVLGQLEKEKGIRRMDFGAEMPTSATGTLSFSMGQIKDKAGEITTRQLGFAGDTFKLNFMTREVGQTFTRFKDLKEADRAQLAAEVGLTRTAYGLQFRTGIAADKSPIWSGLNMMEIEGETGSLQYKTVDLAMSKVQVQADLRTMDPTFNRMAALTNEERTRMALIARRQFNPKAQIAEVTAADKAQINQEAGLDRSTYIVRVDGGPVNTWLSLSSVDSDKGGLSRRSVNLSASRFSLYLNNQEIDESFRRIGNLQPVEKTMFGNEYGMTRSEMGGTLKIAGGDAAFAHKSVADFQGAYVLRQSVDFKSNRLKFKANLQDIDPNFTRIMDLADTDRALLAQERGFSRSDYWVNFQATKALNIDTYVYDSTNVTAGQTRNQNRYKIDYAPMKDRQITFFQDDYAYMSDTGVLSNYSRRKLTFDNRFQLVGGLMFKALSDVNTHQEGDNRPVTTTIDQYHIESGQTAKSSFTLDQLKLDYGDGRFEDTQSVGVKTKAMKNVAFVAGYATTARDSDKSEANGKVGVEWAIKKDLALKLDVNNREGGPKGEQHSHQFSLKGLLAKRLLLFDNININSGINETELRGKQTVCDNAFKVDAGLLGGKVVFDNTDKLNPSNGIYYHSRVTQYESDKDPKKWYHLTYFRQDLITPKGAPAQKRNFAFDMSMSDETKLTLTSYFGKDGQNGKVLPVGGSVFKISHALHSGITLVADYTSDLNQATNRRARVAGLGFHGTLSNKAAVELYYGRCLLDEGSGALNKNVFRIKYDHRISAERFITLTAERKSGVDKASINPFEGDTVGRIDFRTTFD